MLTKLAVSNYALINNLTVEFNSGLNSVTGETGAGKSIILGALGLILGNRADLSVLKSDREKCIVEGVFNIQQYKLTRFFEKNDLDYDDSTILRREITPSGKSRAFINDTPVNLKVIRELGLKLIDIHSQHQNLELGNRNFQLQLVDTVAGTEQLLHTYKTLFATFILQKKELKELKEKSEQAAADLDYFQFQFNQLDEANLEKEEQDELEEELQKLTHAEEIKGVFLEVKQLLDGEQFSSIQNLKESQRKIAAIRDFSKEAADLAKRLESCQIELKDILDEAEGLAEKIEYNPARIEQVNDRLNLIYSLQQKHHVATVEELIGLKHSFSEKIDQVTGYEEEIKALEKQLAATNNKLGENAALLTEQRKKAFGKIEASVLKDLKLLGMPKSKFVVEHELLAEFSPTGKDSVAFMFSANSDVEPAEISKIASGGEMSRLMLAIKNLLRTSRALPTVIFDEIDSGVSGEIALKMGTILKAFSSSAQIINITHLPQIAAKGDSHYVVYKFEQNGKTFTSIKKLEEKERLEELAKMVGGEVITENTLKTARQLLKN